MSLPASNPTFSIRSQPVSGQRIFMINNIHFFQNFMSLYHPQDENFFVISQHDYNARVFDHLFRGHKLIYLPELAPTPPYAPNPAREEQVLEKARQMRGLCAQALDLLPAGAEIFYFACTFTLQFFMLIKALLARNPAQPLVHYRPTTALFPQGKFRVEVIPRARIQAQDPAHADFLRRLSQATGLTLTERNMRLHEPDWEGAWTIKGYGPEEIMGQDLPAPMQPWPQIKAKLGLPPSPRLAKTLLYVDSPLNEYQGLDLEQTRRNLVSFLTHKLNQGWAIHVKPHYRSQGQTAVHGSPLADVVTFLPTVIPVELMMEAYPEIYVISSHAGAMQAQADKYSLFFLMAYTDPVALRRQETQMRMALGTELASIKFVRLNSKQEK